MSRCPLLNKDCIESKCAWWAEFWMQDVGGENKRCEHSCIVTRVPMILLDVLRHTAGDGELKEQIRNRLGSLVEHAGIQNKIFAGMAQVALNRQELSPSEPLKVLDAGSEGS